jgi:patatin-like phospholipase/acyl hydrolase
MEGTSTFQHSQQAIKGYIKEFVQETLIGKKCFTLLSKSNPHYKSTPKSFFFLDDEKDSIAADSSSPVNLDKGGRCDGDGD